MADLANVYFHTLRIPILFLNNVTAWQLWELKCFNMLNGDRFRAIASGRRKVILDKLPGKSLWCYLKQARTTLPAVKAAAREFHRAPQMHSAEFGDNWSHGDATATNVIYDQKTDRARLIDFEIMHEPSQPAVDGMQTIFSFSCSMSWQLSPSANGCLWHWAFWKPAATRT